MNDWISVDERLPRPVKDRLQGVWIFCPLFGPEYLYGYYSPIRNMWFNAWNDRPITNVTHWMRRLDLPEVSDD